MRPSRLSFHQAYAAPILLALREYLELLSGSPPAEPNNPLGKLIKHLLKHWEDLTRFVEVEGAPLDNSIVERALKFVIRNRKNAYFYRTMTGAAVGDVLMSIIHTCTVNGVNPFDYLIDISRNQTAVRHNPEEWLPWVWEARGEQRVAA